MIKGIIKKVASVAVALFGNVCYANNYHDTDFNFSLDYSAGDSYAYTGLRVKEDDWYYNASGLWSPDSI